MIYLSTPYNHENPEIKEERYLLAMDITQFFLGVHFTVFSPIVHCHKMAKKYDLPKDFRFWKEHDEQFILASDEVWFAVAPGYSKSVGMKSEFEMCTIYSKPKRMVLPMPLYKWGQGNYITSDILLGNFLEDHNES